MTSASGTLCGVCATQDVFRDAIFWCPECDEGLCTACEMYHRASKSSKKHEVTSVDDYKQLPSSIANIKQYCSDHEEKYQHYCSQHETLCCPLCLTSNHMKCDFLAIVEVIKTSKISALYDIMEQSIKDMKSNLERITDDREKNLEDIHEQRQRFSTDIKEIRAKINKHLDELEQEIEHNIQAAEQKAISQVDTVLSKISSHSKTIDKLQKNISATKHVATDLQTFLGGKMFEAEVQKEEKFMQSLKEDGDFQQIKLECKIDDHISDILCMTQMGQISITANPPTITVSTNREKHAQQMIPTIPKTINEINLTLLARFEISKRKGLQISGCTIMPSRKIVFVDQVNHSLVIHNENGVFESEILVSQSPVDVTGIDENTVAVTHNSRPYHTEVIDIANKLVVKMIKTPNMCYGITKREGRLIFYTFGTGIQTVDVTDESTFTTLVKVDYKNHSNYVTASKDETYHACPGSNTVTCYTVTGQKIWEYTHELMLHGIRDITVDNDSNVYVASYGNNNVVVISPDGNDAHRLLGEENEIKKPHGIHIDNKKNNLLVVNFCGTAFLYNIK
ncbi:uncharacterized protein LOC134705980 [Mytilus trossulus]|uniref:uncharacterized protein LOC134705980 n=1 Tax=Mytilus trossulus TaxID=6551 RepID=UPI003005F08D